MAGFLNRFGQSVGKKARQANWWWQSLAGSEQDLIQAEERVGGDLAAAFRADMAPATSSAARASVVAAGERLGRCVRNPNRRFRFELVRAEEANAFALPGGYIFLTEPLLELIDSVPDRLAFVLGHEMGHVIRMDPMHRAVSDAGIAAILRKTPMGGLAGTFARSTAGQLMRSAYSQDQEFMADRFGLRLGMAAGYRPEAGIAMLQAIGQRAGTQPSGLAAYFASHPPIPERIQSLQAYLHQKT
ncbi:MAG: M48 family metallopeptidase [Phycisphaerae bacterium]|nr:M48 family metallopeptidase [Phycisphaerae bacterium]